MRGKALALAVSVSRLEIGRKGDMLAEGVAAPRVSRLRGLVARTARAASRGESLERAVIPRAKPRRVGSRVRGLGPCRRNAPSQRRPESPAGPGALSAVGGGVGLRRNRQACGGHRAGTAAERARLGLRRTNCRRSVPRRLCRGEGFRCRPAPPARRQDKQCHGASARRAGEDGSQGRGVGLDLVHGLCASARPARNPKRRSLRQHASARIRSPDFPLQPCMNARIQGRNCRVLGDTHLPHPFEQRPRCDTEPSAVRNSARCVPKKDVIAMARSRRRLARPAQWLGRTLQP